MFRLGTTAALFRAAILCAALLSSGGRADEPRTPTPADQAKIKERDRLIAETNRLRRLDRLDEAVAAAEKTLAVQREITGPDHAAVVTRLTSLVRLQLDCCDVAAAGRCVREDLDLVARLYGKDDWHITDARVLAAHVERVAALTPEQRKRLAQARRLNQKRLELVDARRYREALPLAQEVLESYLQLLGDDDEDTATICNNIGVLYRNQGDNVRAATFYGRARDAYRKSIGEQHPHYATIVENIGLLELSQGEIERAEPLLLQAATIREKILGANSTQTISAEDSLADVYDRLTERLEERGNFTAARKTARKQMDLLTRVHGADHWQTTDARLTLADVDRLAILTPDQRRRLIDADQRQREAEGLKNEGKIEEGFAACRQALAARKEILGDGHRATADSLNLLGLLYYRAGDLEQAEPILRQALKTRKTVLGENHPHYASSLNNVGCVLDDRKDWVRAEPLFREAYERATKSLGSKNSSTQTDLKNLINLCQRIAAKRRADQDYAAAAKMWQEVARLKTILLGSAHWEVTEARFEANQVERIGKLAPEQRDRLAEASKAHQKMEQLFARGLYRAALEPCQQAVSIRKEILGENDRDYANTLAWLGYLYIALKDDARAEPPYRQAVDIGHRVLGDKHPTVAGSLKQVADLYSRMGTAAEQKGENEAALRANAGLVEMRSRLYGPTNWQTVDARIDLKFTERWVELSPEQRRQLTEAGKAHTRMIDLCRQSKYSEAFATCRQALKVRTELLGDNNAFTAASQSSLGYLYFKTGEPGMGKPLLLKSTEVRKKVLGEFHPRYVESLYSLTEFYQETGDYDRAESYFRRALRIAQDLGTETDSTGDYYFNNLVTMYERQAGKHQDDGDWAAASRAWEKVVELLTYRNGPSHWKVANARLDLAYAETVARFTPEQRRRRDEAAELARKENALYSAGKYAEALPLARQALASNRDLLGEDSARYAIWLQNLGDLHYALGDMTQAESFYLQALARRKALLGETHPDYAVTLEYLGDLYKDTSQFARAEPLYQQALSIRQRTLGDSHVDTARSLNRLALIHIETGRNDLAEPLLQKAVEIVRKTPNAVYATYLQNLALVYKNMGDYARAEPLYQEAVAVCRKATGVSKSELASSLSGLAGLYVAIEESAKAEPLYQEALDLRRKAFGPEHPLCAQSLLNLAELYLARNDLNRAEPVLQECLQIRKKAFGENHPSYAAALSDLAWMYALRGDYDRAEPLYRQRLEGVRKTSGEANPEFALALNDMAWFYEERGDYPQAATFYRQCLDVSRQVWDLAAVSRSERQQMQMGKALRARLDAYLSVAPRAGLIAEEEYPYVLAWKGAVFDRQRWAREQRRVLRERKGDVAKLYTDLQTTSARLAALALAGPDQRQQANQLRDLTLRKEKLENELARHGELFHKKDAAGPTVGQLRAALPAGAALLDFLEYTACNPPKGDTKSWSYERHLLAFVVRRGHAVEAVSLGPVAPIAAAVERWRERYGAGRAVAGPDPAGELQRLVWQPLQEFLGGVKTILVSPDGALARFPFAALPGKSPGTYLIEDLAVAVVPVPRMLPDLLAESTAGPQASAGATLLVLGDVDFGSAPAPATDGKAPARGRNRLLPIVPPLEGTRAEIAAVREAFGQRFPDGRVRELRGEEATKDALRQNAPNARWLHLATHGFFAPPEVRSALAPTVTTGGADNGPDLFARQGLAGFNPGLLSGLVLAGANRPAEAGKNDGVLTALEVESLDLSAADLVVLSACETGLGETAGGEGLLGLQRAFQVAGARSVVAGLWKVDDHATQALMKEFYRQLWGAKKSRLEALRQAQLTLLHTYDPAAGRTRGVGGTATDMSSRSAGAPLPPFYWAAFALSGDWR